MENMMNMTKHLISVLDFRDINNDEMMLDSDTGENDTGESIDNFDNDTGDPSKYAVNISDCAWDDNDEWGLSEEHDYWILPIFVIFITSGVFGNILVCLAISTNRELQNMTNYFLMSLAVADLLVCMIVMPFGAVVYLKGSWPLSEGWCAFYQTCDVLACSVSIQHLMFISIRRYRGIRRPLRQRTEGSRSVLYRVVLTWGLGLLLASPIPALALIDMKNIMRATDICEMNNGLFMILGSLLSFYIPMVIMVTTYGLTIHHLKKQKLCSVNGTRHVIASGGSNQTFRYSATTAGRWRQKDSGFSTKEDDCLSNFKALEESRLRHLKAQEDSRLSSFRAKEGSRIGRFNVQRGDSLISFQPQRGDSLTSFRPQPGGSLSSFRPQQRSSFNSLFRQQGDSVNSFRPKPGGSLNSFSLRGNSLNSSSNSRSIAGTELYHRCCRLQSSRATQTPLDIAEEMQMTNTPVGQRKMSLARPLKFAAAVSRLPSQSVTLSEEKASRVLGIVFTTFVVCWAPFFITNLVVVLCPACSLPFPLGTMALWLGYASSTLNPLIYTVFNIKFRRSFGKLLLCRAGSLRNYQVNSSL